MQTKNIDYHEERSFAGTRLIILFILFLSSFVISTDVITQIPLVRLVLGAMILLSILYNAFIAFKPDMFLLLRKNAVILFDLSALTLLILIFEKYGIYLFVFYVLIAIQSSLYFGKKYAYASIAYAAVSWLLLSIYSPYWHTHHDMIIILAVSTFLISLFSLHFIRRAEKRECAPDEIVIEVESDETVIEKEHREKHKFPNLPSEEKYDDLLEL
jgi:hypothetical protein